MARDIAQEEKVSAVMNKFPSAERESVNSVRFEKPIARGVRTRIAKSGLSFSRDCSDYQYFAVEGGL